MKTIGWLATLAFFAIAPLQASADDKTVVPFLNGMTIKTGNSVANIEVRAKSLGPGACGVTFSADNGASTQFLAPPLTYSPWTVLASHTGSASFTITHSVACSTGVIGEVRYYK
jgi:hypothetical protein